MVCSVARFDVIFGTVYLIYVQIILSLIRVMCYKFHVYLLF